MNVFELRDNVINEYGDYVRSFFTIRDKRIEDYVNQGLQEGLLWPQPLIQLNPAFAPGESLQELVDKGVLHPQCLKIFRRKDSREHDGGPLKFHRHQVESIYAARSKANYVLTTGTGSGKSLAYIVPIVDHVLQRGSGRGIQAIIVYPMNALANSQLNELEKFLCHGFPQGHPPVTFRRYTGQEDHITREEIKQNPPDILLTNYMMLELIMTRDSDRSLVENAKGLAFFVLDELHTYRGRQGADVALLARRVQEACQSPDLIHVGTSATLSSQGTWSDQQQEVAVVASTIFGAPVLPQNIIGETLRRLTNVEHVDTAALRTRVSRGAKVHLANPDEFCKDPLVAWLEAELGVHEEPQTGRLIRCKPRAINGDEGIAAKLAAQIDLPADECAAAIKQTLLAGYNCRDQQNRSLFAFRLHQFISKGSSVYASPESEDTRVLTLQPQQFVPGSNREKVFLPLAFCRECGQEFYIVFRETDAQGVVRYAPRELSDKSRNEKCEPGYLYLNTLANDGDLQAALPDDWYEEKGSRIVIRDVRKKYLPRELKLSPAGMEVQSGLRSHFFPAPFLFCPCCHVAYDLRNQKDFGKLSTLGSEGRSTATTVLTLSTIRRLKTDQELDQKARKLLSFADNRQDVSLQAGHFNDFVEIGILRAALWQAVNKAGAQGLRDEKLAEEVFKALNLPLELYAQNPLVEYEALDETKKALRDVLNYRLYRDLLRGWRITSPNLEQCGLLSFEYSSLAQFCAAQAKWEKYHPALATASAATREAVSKVLLDYMRRELAIYVDCFSSEYQERLKKRAFQHLNETWGFDDSETLERGHIVLPRSRGHERNNSFNFTYLSPRCGFGLYLKRPDTFPNLSGSLKTADIEQIITDLLEALTVPGILQISLAKKRPEDASGYQLKASAMIWRVGDGEQAFYDPVRMSRKPTHGLRANQFFINFYRSDIRDLQQVKAAEHTAQVAQEVRQNREQDFRQAKLPIMYCSPTMELGVDIAELNVVNMRNIPPSPANYAQRSGRAGRSGQPAFVFSYCAAGSPHDQYFFRRPHKMVAGAVAPPRLELANEDLIRAHVHAIWLSESQLSLKGSLCGILDVQGDSPSLKLQEHVEEALNNPHSRKKSLKRAKNALGSAIARLAGEEKVDAWLEQTLNQMPLVFDRACERWRGLYRSALNQSNQQHKIINDASRTVEDREEAKRLREEADSKLNILRAQEDEKDSDFYSYRYFASEGFLPGYNFARLPLLAYIPGRLRLKGRNNYLSRPRFLAISEFGPQNIIYHEGSRYQINKVTISDRDPENNLTRRALLCPQCGYLHPLATEAGPDLCENCGSDKLGLPRTNLFRMQTVNCYRRDRINSEEEERTRQGYRIRTGIRFETREGRPSARLAQFVDENGALLANLSYSHTATLWRINFGWNRTKPGSPDGFNLDIKTGKWERDPEETDEEKVERGTKHKRVIPYVEDSRNSLLVQPAKTLSTEMMATMQAALKTAIQIRYQLEDAELAAEPLPDPDARRQLLFYEASEGGAGVLSQILDDEKALASIARQALKLAHFDPDTGQDRQLDKEPCDAACYSCLLSYYNQRDHRLIDRKLLPELLRPWLAGRLIASPTALPRDEHLQILLHPCQSELERKFLRRLEELSLKLPTNAQVLIKEAQVSLDFLYSDQAVAVFIDGPPHDIASRQEQDRKQQERLENLGYTVIRFNHQANWDELFVKYAAVFGKKS